MHRLLILVLSLALAPGCDSSFKVRADLGVDLRADARQQDQRAVDAPRPDAGGPWSCPGAPLAETADSSQTAGFLSSVVVLDEAGETVVYILHHNFAGSDTLLAVGRGGTWTSETVLEDRGLAQGTLLAAGPGGTLHATFNDVQSASLLYGVRSSPGKWTLEAKPVGGVTIGAACGAALAVGGDGSLHVVTYTDQVEEAVYLRRAAGGSGWDKAVTVEPDPRGGLFPGPDPGLAVDSGGTVHVALCTGANAIKHYERSGSGFTATQIAAGVGDQCTSSLAVDEKGGVHVSYRDAKLGRMMYARRLPGEASFETPEKLYAAAVGGGLGMSNHIVVDSAADHVWVAFDATFLLSANAQVAHRRNGSWQKVASVDPGGGRYLSGALSSAGALHLAHHHTAQSVLRHVRVCP